MGRKVKFKSDKHRRAVFAAIAAKKAGGGSKTKVKKKLSGDIIQRINISKSARKGKYELIKKLNKGELKLKGKKKEDFKNLMKSEIKTTNADIKSYKTRGKSSSMKTLVTARKYSGGKRVI